MPMDNNQILATLESLYAGVNLDQHQTFDI